MHSKIKLLIFSTILISIAVFASFLLSHKPPQAEGPQIITYHGITPFPDSKFISFNEIHDPSVAKFEKRYFYVWESNKSVIEIRNWFEQNYVKEGWKIDVFPSDPKSDIQQIEFDIGVRHLIISITKDGNRSKISMDLRPGPITEDGEEAN